MSTVTDNTYCWALLALAKGTETLKQHWHCDANMSCICFVLQLLWLPPVLTPTNLLTTSHTHLFITRFRRSIGLWISL